MPVRATISKLIVTTTEGLDLGYCATHQITSKVSVSVSVSVSVTCSLHLYLLSICEFDDMHTCNIVGF